VRVKLGGHRPVQSYSAPSHDKCDVNNDAGWIDGPKTETGQLFDPAEGRETDGEVPEKQQQDEWK